MPKQMRAALLLLAAAREVGRRSLLLFLLLLLERDVVLVVVRLRSRSRRVDSARVRIAWRRDLGRAWDAGLPDAARTLAPLAFLFTTAFWALFEPPPPLPLTGIADRRRGRRRT
jgi:hypothetical protein